MTTERAVGVEVVVGREVGMRPDLKKGVPGNI